MAKCGLRWPKSRGGGTGGARGARAPPIFWGEGHKIYLRFFHFGRFFSNVHPLILLPCAAAEALFYNESRTFYFLTHGCPLLVLKIQKYKDRDAMISSMSIAACLLKHL